MAKSVLLSSFTFKPFQVWHKVGEKPDWALSLTQICLLKDQISSASVLLMTKDSLWRKLSAEELMLLNCGVGEDSWESLGLQGDPNSPS